MSKFDEATQSMIRNLENKTGKSFDEWQKIARKSKLAKHGEIVKFLKSEHSLTHGYANLVAHQVLQSDASSFEADDLIQAQYAGAKAALRPIYDALVAEVSRFGKDVEFAPKKAYVSLRRNKQFALIQPSTASRLDLGLNLKGVEPTGKLEASGSFNAMCSRFDVGINLKGVAPSGRLEASGSFNAMVSHRVRVTEVKEVDAELIGWLRQAYEQA